MGIMVFAYLTSAIVTLVMQGDAAAVRQMRQLRVVVTRAKPEGVSAC